MSNDLAANMRRAEADRARDAARRRNLNAAAREMREKHEREFEEWMLSRTGERAVFLHAELRESYGNSGWEYRGVVLDGADVIESTRACESAEAAQQMAAQWGILDAASDVPGATLGVERRRRSGPWQTVDRAQGSGT